MISKPFIFTSFKLFVLLLLNLKCIHLILSIFTIYVECQHEIGLFLLNVSFMCVCVCVCVCVYTHTQ